MKLFTVNVISESAFTVQGHGVHTAFTEMISALKSHENVNLMVNSNRRADVVHLHTVGIYCLLKLLFSRSAIVVSAHVMPDSFVGSLIGARHWLKYAEGYLKWFYNRADAVLAVSQEVANQLGEMGVTTPVHVVPNTINTSAYKTSANKRSRARQKLGFGQKDFVVVGVGQIQPRKRVDSFVEAARHLPDCQFVWVGGIPFKKAAADYEGMQKLMKSAPENMLFTGEAKHAEIAEYYAAANLFFLPSEQETFGIVIVEAAASSLPILLRDLTQYRQTFEGNYAIGSDKDFAVQIRKIRENSKWRAELVGKAHKIATMYDSKNTAERLLEVYKRVIKR